MENSTGNPSRRERNKQDKLERISSAARSLFAQKGVDDVTTAEVAQKADVAAGTLFLYAKTKGELLLLAQNANYRDAHEQGVKAAAAESDCVSALLALLAPIIHCNREHVGNGRSYLQEVVFGTSTEGYRGEAQELMLGTQNEVGRILSRTTVMTEEQAELSAQVVMSIIFLTLSSPLNVDLSDPKIMTFLRQQFSEVVVGRTTTA